MDFLPYAIIVDVTSKNSHSHWWKILVQTNLVTKFKHTLYVHFVPPYRAQENENCKNK